VWQAPSGSGSRPLITLSPSQSRVAIYEVAGNRTADGEAWVRRIGGQLNAELREGRWDAHLAPVR
jgi:hypothetical protein